MAGESEGLAIDYSVVDRASGETVRFRVVVNDAEDAPLPELVECHPDNNSSEATAMCFVLG